MKFNKTERIGVYSIAKIFANDFEWVFREQPINDFGIDAIVETTEKVNPIKKYINPTGKLIGIQIKSGKSYFKESNSIGIVFRGEKKHLKYWSNYSIPVIIVIHDEEKEISYWQVVNNSTTVLTNQHWKIIIPFENVLSIQKIKQLKDIAKYRTQYEYKLSLFKNSEFLIEELLRNKKYFLYIGIGEHYIKKDEYFISLLFSNEDYEIPYEALYSGSGVNWYFSINEEKKLIDSIKEIVPWASLYKGNEPYTDNLIKDQIVKSYRELKLYDKNEISKAENNSLLRLSCWLTGEWSFRADLKANKLAKSFKTLNDFLKKESGIIKD